MTTSLNHSVNKGFSQFASFFPQMKPEKKVVALSEEAKAVFELLGKTGRTDLNNLKNQSGLSGKKWDKAIKEITASKLAKVEKTEDGLFVEVV